MKLIEAAGQSLLKQVMGKLQESGLKVDLDQLAWCFSYFEAQTYSEASTKDMAHLFYDTPIVPYKGNVQRMEEYVETWTEGDSEGLDVLVQHVKEFFQHE